MAASPKGGEGKKSRRGREAGRGKKPEKEVFFFWGGGGGKAVRRSVMQFVPPRDEYKQAT